MPLPVSAYGCRLVYDNKPALLERRRQTGYESSMVGVIVKRTFRWRELGVNLRVSPTRSAWKLQPDPLYVRGA
jgi:hypothetical protein